MTRKDQLVRATDLDALSCRRSANEKGYFLPPDPYISPLVAAYEQCLQHCDGYTQYLAAKTLRQSFRDLKYPLINRGTFLRTRCVDTLVAGFIAEHGRCQIVALGGGSDTRAFRVLGHGAEHVTYTEIDFPEQTRVKRVAILNLPLLQRAVGCDVPAESVDSGFRALPSDLHLPRYHLVGFDLRQLPERGIEAGLSFLDLSTPTLLLSECVLCYLTPAENVQVLQYFARAFEHVAIAMYDPMGLNDAFGRTMAENLAMRGLDLGAFVQYPDLASRRAFFERLGFQPYLTDLARVGGYGAPELAWLSSEEMARVSRLEMIDEVEEISMLLKHYCLIYAECNMLLQFAQKLKWFLP